MKKITILLAATLISLSSYCQELDNPVYFRFGFSNPSWESFDIGKEGWGSEVRKFGANFEFGSIFLIQSLPQAENSSFGINVDYLYANYNNFHVGEGDESMDLGIVRVGSKIGPSFTYSPHQEMAFDLYVKADFAWATAVVPYAGSMEKADDYFTGFATLGLSTGINYRYGHFMLGFEFNTISPKLESDNMEGVYIQKVIDGLTGENSGSKKSKLPTMNFTIGMNF